jgi:hypothetical protein
MRNVLVVFASLAWLACFPVSAPGAVFSDNFNSGPSASWGDQVGSWSVVAGEYKAGVPSNYPNAHSTLPFNLTDFTVDVDLNGISDGGIWLRSQEAPGTVVGLTGVLLVIRSGDAYWHIVSDGSGYGASLNAVATPFTSSSGHARVVVSADTYTLYADGSASPATILTDATFTNGQVGLYSFTSSLSFDNFELVPEPAAAAVLLLGWTLLPTRRR